MFKPATGQMRFNTDTNQMELYNGAIWQAVAGVDKLPKYKVISTYNNHHVVDVDKEVLDWILSDMPMHMWKYNGTPSTAGTMDSLIVSDKLLMLMRLKFVE